MKQKISNVKRTLNDAYQNVRRINREKSRISEAERNDSLTEVLLDVIQALNVLADVVGDADE